MKLGAALERAFREGLASIDLEGRTRDVTERAVRTADDVHVVAIGKGAAAMLSGACSALGPRLVRALAVVPDGIDVATRDPRIEVMHAAHPVADRRSVAAADAALAYARDARSGTLLALISGGASALACAPVGVTLAQKMSIFGRLTSAGATITELNTVRRHLSGLKGGGLARVCAPARVVTIVASDVIGGAAWDVGSGPSLVDPTTTADARAVLRRYGIEPPKMQETLKPVKGGARVERARFVTTPALFAGAVAAALAHRRFRVLRANPATRDIDRFVREYARMARDLPPGGAVVRAAEPTLVFDAARAGRGGRCGHLAALMACHLPRDVVFLAAASDGVDGSSGAAGAVVDVAFVDALGERRIARAIAAHATAALHERAGTRIALGPTGHNVCDVHILARALA